MKTYEVQFKISPLERDFGGDRESIVVQAKNMDEAEKVALAEIRVMFPNSEPEWLGSKLQKS